jgi:hypothetical protein
MEYQKGLRRIQSELEGDLKALDTLRTGLESKFKKDFGIDTVEFDLAWQQLSKVCIGHGIPTEANMAAVRASAQKLQAFVANDPNAKKLADIRILEAAVTATKTPLDLVNELATLRLAIGQLKAEQKDQLHVQMLVPLFKAASELFSKIEPTGVCPLCHNKFEGDLKEHVKSEFARMQHLQALLTKLQSAKDAVSVTLSRHKNLITTLDEAMETVKPGLIDEFPGKVKDTAKKVDNAIARIASLLAFDSTALTDKVIADIAAGETEVSSVISTFETSKNIILEEAKKRRLSLENDSARVKLVTDNQLVSSGLSLIDAINIQTYFYECAHKVSTQFAAIVEHFVRASLEDVQKRFDQISDKVKTFFETLEKNTEGLGAPKMKLLTDQDRSVVLEVFFHNTTVQPAHKYLSESQLNSFGLAVFLASATHFNKECSFILLDDVVNSFDAYKRPQLIDLIKDHLEGQQIVLLTHDQFWMETLQRRLPNWKRIKFAGYKFGIGPMLAPAPNALERVQKCLEADEPDQASTILANYLEDVLQDLCEAFEVECKFNRRNEYTLDTLIDRLRVRVKDKLKKEHPLSIALEKLFEDNTYRNWAIHCKNPVAPIQKDEIRTVLENWQVILRLCFCQHCFEMLRYDGHGAFRCKCGKQHLQKPA